MMTAADLLDALMHAYAPAHPVRFADTSNNLGGVITIVVTPDRVTYEPAPCQDGAHPFQLRAEILAVAGGGTADLQQGLTASLARALTAQTGTLAGIARAAGWDVTGWEPADVDGQPAILFTATATGKE